MNWVYFVEKNNKRRRILPYVFLRAKGWDNSVFLFYILIAEARFDDTPWSVFMEEGLDVKMTTK